MTTRELAAAGVTDPRLQAAYLRCRELNARHGRTYFLATRLLTADRRPAVHALYGFARWADDIVDDLGDQAPAAERARALDQLQTELEAGLSTGRSSHPVVAAVADTAERYGIEHRHFTDFMSSMRMDLDITDYATWDDLAGYVHGSASVIGLQVLPVLGTCAPRAEAAPHAASLGIAFQLTNFLRDVGEDLDRGRVYLPADRLAAYGVDHELLARCRRTGEQDHRVIEALRELVAFNRGIYRHAALGVPMLDAVSRPCVSTALVLYRGILDRIEAADYAPVLQRRVVVPEHRRAAVALSGLLRVAAARTRHRLAPRPASWGTGTRDSVATIAREPLG